jgi:hypothetical protein
MVSLDASQCSVNLSKLYSAGNLLLHSVFAAVTYYSDTMANDFFLKKISFKATIFISPNMPGLSFECVRTQNTD